MGRKKKTGACVVSKASAVERPSTFPIPNHPMIRTGTGIDLVKFGSATKEKKEKKKILG